MMKEAMGHCRVQQNSDYSTVQDPIISLESGVCLKFGPNDTVFSVLETELQG
jgi:hypothetical protein